MRIEDGQAGALMNGDDITSIEDMLAERLRFLQERASPDIEADTEVPWSEVAENDKQYFKAIIRDLSAYSEYFLRLYKHT